LSFFTFVSDCILLGSIRWTPSPLIEVLDHTFNFVQAATGVSPVFRAQFTASRVSQWNTSFNTFVSAQIFGKLAQRRTDGFKMFLKPAQRGYR